MPIAQAGPPRPAVPSAIEVVDGNKVFMVGHAVGVQIHCTATSSDSGWGLVAPRANLYGDNAKLIITHFGGPTWQAKNGSSVVGRLDASVTIDATAIPWLRLAASSTTARPDGNRLVPTTFIQRTATTGGLAPRRGIQRGHGRYRGRRAIHRRLLLLEEDRCLTQRLCAGGPARRTNRNA
jgi:Protein of unknown function (DUF3455)